ncbi:MAG: PEP-CTERM sorting domain-containing protein [Verrucomicrobia bacterium]|nr:PEP-CTERM sorting domain-containing protein [Verrucomicrobiota bacterium]
MSIGRTGIGIFVLGFALMALSAQANLLLNPDFETGDFTSWTTNAPGWRLGGGADNHTPSGSFGAVNDVSTTDTAGQQYRILQQEMAASPGELWSASVYLRTVNLESSQSFLEVQFWNNSDGVIGQFQSSIVSSDQPFTLMSISDVAAPAGTVKISVRGVIEMVSVPTGNTDFHIFDDFEATVVPEPSTWALISLGAAGLALIRRRKKV